MSSFSAIWTRTPSPTLRPMLQRALDTLVPYAADGQRLWNDREVALGTNLFLQLPEDRSDLQPLHHEQADITLAGDFRLDNRQELAETLGLPATSAVADSALVLAAWETWGERCVDHLLGGFAFTVWDARRRTLFAARDHAGDNTLCFYDGPDFFALATLPKALLALPGVDPAFDRERIALWMINAFQDRHATFFQHIKRLPAGHTLHVHEQDGCRTVHVAEYWHPSGKPQVRYPRDSDYAEALAELLDRTTAPRLRSLGDIGAQLSAGLDSSSVVASAARLLGADGQQLTAYTAVPRPGFETRGFSCMLIPDEREGAAQVAAFYPNVRHVSVDSTGFDLLETIRAGSNLMDQPVLNGVNWLWITAILRQAAADGNRVMLQGAVGNGTVSFDTTRPMTRYFRTGQWRKLANMVQTMRRDGEMSYRAAAGIALNGLAPDWLQTHLDRRRTQDLADFSLDFSAVNPEFARQHNLHQIAFDASFHGPQTDAAEQSYLFEWFDFAPIQAAARALSGVDLRDPTCDKRVWEFCFSIPHEQWVAGGHSRSLIRRAMQNRLPASTVNRYARGFQGADWHLILTQALPAMHAELDRIEQSPAAREMLDLPRLRRLVETFPTQDFQKPQTRAIWHLALLRGLTMGMFLRDYEPAT